MTHRFPQIRMIAFLIIVAMPFAAFAADDVGSLSGGGSAMEFRLNVSGHDSVTLRVSSPSGESFEKTFKNGKAVQLRLSDLGELEQGTYTYELSVNPKVSSELKAKLEKARAANDNAAAKKLMKDAGLTDLRQTGGITVGPEGFVWAGLEETDANDIATSRPGSVGTNAARPGGRVAVNDQVIPDDLIVQGSECVGLDCVNNENFGFDTIRLKENNLRIHYDDTSTTAGFPANDWRLIANDSASGGSSKFSIEDSTGAKTPFTITAGATTNSIFVDSTGRVGFRTSTPVLDLHVATSNTPAIRLEQNNSGGFTAQTWDIGANEANFFVRDVTGGSRLSLRIRPGAPTSSVDISADGDVGIGTGSPAYQLNVVDTGAVDDTVLQIENNGATRMRIKNTSSGETWNFGHQSPSGTGLVLSDTGDGTSELLLDVSGNMTIAGMLTQNSSRDVKYGFENLDPAATLAAVRQMPIQTWVYTNDHTAARHAGPIAEDFHAAFQLGTDNKHIAPSDQSGIALAAIQGLADLVQQKDKEIADLSARLAELEKKLNEQK